MTKKKNKPKSKSDGPGPPPEQPKRLNKRITYVYPRWNKAVSTAVSPYIGRVYFHPGVTDRDAIREHETHVMGKFTCSDKSCKMKAWSSKMISIVIQKYPGNEYNAIIYNQRCKKCNNLGCLHLDKECYIERVAYRLKQWAGLMMEKPYYAEKKGPPHKSKLCEGCKRGVCRERDGD
ncbi:hypothetical protein BU23DRAFT_457231 [Bimuria novae-zelandiae CBS 107.79]|uniref:3CxxC-type domain-containing protein n=1 Tax=Bimuria novae-zelandiae CBS 107.79 TaxID=1447943 RepID=A0A6A5VFN0_9PLEO|nr:hypothetical protein BU23DRAFT_457231 [Bimuria novae-zelandiae CBS 107.79]